MAKDIPSSIPMVKNLSITSAEGKTDSTDIRVRLDICSLSTTRTIIAGIDVPVCKRRMRPHDVASLSRSRGFQKMGATDFFVLLWSQSGDDQIALLIK